MSKEPEFKQAAKEHQVADPVRTPGPYPQAVAEIDEKLAADPKNAKLWMERGLALSTGCFMREAVEAYSRAIELEPFNGLLYRHRGHRHVSCWEFEEAAADFVVASRLIPENWDVWYHLGLSYYLLGRYEDALAAYARCYAISDKMQADNFCAVTDWYWRTLMRLGKQEEAAQLLKKLPEGFEKAEDVCGYTLNCALYTGILTPETLLEDRLVDGHLDAITSLYALSNYYYVMGDLAKSNEIVEKCLEFADDNQWCSFGYLAARVDKAARAK